MPLNFDETMDEATGTSKEARRKALGDRIDQAKKRTEDAQRKRDKVVRPVVQQDAAKIPLTSSGATPGTAKQGRNLNGHAHRLGELRDKPPRGKKKKR